MFLIFIRLGFLNCAVQALVPNLESPTSFSLVSQPDVALESRVCVATPSACWTSGIRKQHSDAAQKLLLSLPLPVFSQGAAIPLRSSLPSSAVKSDSSNLPC